MLTGAALSSAIALLAFSSRADAHGHLKSPEPTFEDGAPTVEWVTLIENYWDIGSGGDQVGKYKTMAAEKGMSVKDVVLDMVKDKTCGYTLADADPKPVPSDGKAIWWGNGGGGFTHTGPCEVYINDKMVLHGDDCEDEYPGGPDGSNKMSEMPIDYSSCNGDCTLTIYWLAFQNAQWQAYINCVPLKGSGSSTQTQTQSSAGSSTEDQSKEETPSTETQSTEVPSTEAPSTDAPSTETQSEGTPATTEAPDSVAQEAPSPETPSTGTDTKCTPARRLRKKTSTL
ncbi:hypothetical protein G195_011278 [Phytophthora kernoviae 00238/432]|uniref:SCP domain-containing protein n=1 Tax=Phytophthora kernoviae 00238/432 TaxID=1284355 RepID=A0A8J4RQC0_9STRA|nr:hypothetical protein G195_011278 [Phytophthora kernoviae 00238/432]